jgi:uncharacterized membrane protein
MLMMSQIRLAARDRLGARHEINRKADRRTSAFARSFGGLAVALSASAPTSLFEPCRGLAVALRAEADKGGATRVDPWSTEPVD